MIRNLMIAMTGTKLMIIIWKKNQSCIEKKCIILFTLFNNYSHYIKNKLKYTKYIRYMVSNN